MAQEGSPVGSPRGVQSTPSDSDDGGNTSLYPFDELSAMTNESKASTQSLNESSAQDRHLSSSPVCDTSMEKTARTSPKGLKIDNLRRRSIHKTGPEIRNEQTTAISKEEPARTRWIIVLLILLIAPFLYKKFIVAEKSIVKEETVPELHGRELMVSNFKKSFGDVRSEFPSQTKRLWATVSACSKSVLKTETPSQPGILLLVSSAEGKQTMRCLTKRISELLMKAYNDASVTVFHVGDHLSLNGSQLKLEIDKVFRDGLGMRHEHVAILHDLDKVSGHAAMMFHGYCDNESAPFKDAMIIFTMEVLLSENSVMSMEEREVEELAESRLQSVWETDIGYDNIMALKSRVANNIGVIRAENATKAVC